MRGSAANYYHPEGFDTSDKTLMGRQAAGEAFLKAYALHSGTAQLYCYTKSKAMFDYFRARLADLTGRAQAAEWIPHQKVNELEKAGCLFVPGPNTADMVWQRRHFDVRGYSGCGVTHTTASESIMDSIGNLMIAPYQTWDAVICASQAVRETYRQVLGDWGDYLSECTGGVAQAPVQLPVIPLGVDCTGLRAEGKAPRWRKEWREKLNIGDDDIVMLFMGRLSYHAKAHPLRNDPFTVFAGYPSAYLDGQARIALNPGAAQNWFKKIRQDPMVSFAPYIFLSDDDMDRPLEKLDEIGECDINTVLEASASAQRGVVHRTLAWLTKLNVIRIVSARKRADG
jgi:hypothetical protein